jgi:hypothetical protein
MERPVVHRSCPARAAIYQCSDRFDGPETIFIRSVSPPLVHATRPRTASISVTMQGRSRPSEPRLTSACHLDLQVGADADVIHVDRGLDRIHFLCVVADVPLSQRGVVGGYAGQLQDTDSILK